MRPRTASRAEQQWWAISSLALLTLGLVLGLVVRGTAVPGWDVAAAQLAQRPASRALDQIAWAASRIGDAWTGALFVSAVAIAWVFWRGRIDLALFLAAVSAVRALDSLLKAFFQSPRPPAAIVSILEPVTGYGYPSGHAFGAALVYGAIAVALPQVVPDRRLGRVAQCLALAMALLIAWSRVRLGAHWFSDVVGGLLFGFGAMMLLYAALLTVRRLANGR